MVIAYSDYVEGILGKIMKGGSQVLLRFYKGKIECKWLRTTVKYLYYSTVLYMFMQINSFTYALINSNLDV